MGNVSRPGTKPFQRSRKHEEPSARSIAANGNSRAYYAAFGASVAWVKEQFPDQQLPSHGEIHQVIAEFFLFHAQADYRAVGGLLRDMRFARNHADYRPQLADPKRLAQRNIFDANRVLNALSGLETENAA